VICGVTPAWRPPQAAPGEMDGSRPEGLVGRQSRTKLASGIVPDGDHCARCRGRDRMRVSSCHGHHTRPSISPSAGRCHNGADREQLRVVSDTRRGLPGRRRADTGGGIVLRARVVHVANWPARRLAVSVAAPGHTRAVCRADHGVRAAASDVVRPPPWPPLAPPDGDRGAPLHALHQLLCRKRRPRVHGRATLVRCGHWLHHGRHRGCSAGCSPAAVGARHDDAGGRPRG
jgi:hypothetical protein